MNMRFAALLLFVGVTSAEWWCWEASTGWNNGNTCPREGAGPGEATTLCCRQIGANPASNGGCDITEDAIIQNFDFCCRVTWDCTGSQQ